MTLYLSGSEESLRARSHMDLLGSRFAISISSILFVGLIKQLAFELLEAHKPLVESAVVELQRFAVERKLSPSLQVQSIKLRSS